MGIRVASVPAGHVYVRHLSSHLHDDVVRLPDPLPGPDLPAAQWWPPPMLEAAWVHAHAGEFDLMHIHFGFDARSPSELAELGAALRAEGRPLVLTVHDLRNPHHVEPGLHDAQLSVLVETADAVVTLTPGAAAEVERRWRRRAEVLPHPHVVEEPVLSRPRPRHDGFVVGVHAKSLRASMAPLPVVETLVETLGTLAGSRLRVDAHTDVMTPGSARYAPDLAEPLREFARDERLELAVHDYFTDAELWDYLQGLDVSVLPYRFGTHSGWLEACHDLGTTVLAPDCGYYAEQRPCLPFAASPPRRGPTLAAAVRRAYVERPAWRADPRARGVEREHLDRAHARLYAAAVDRSAACTS